MFVTVSCKFVNNHLPLHQQKTIKMILLTTAICAIHAFSLPINNGSILFKKKSPCHPVWGARGLQATMAFFHSIFSERESFAMINRDEDDEERDRLQRHLRGVDDVRDVLPSLRASPPIRGVRVGTYPSSHQSRGASLEWYRLP